VGLENSLKKILIEIKKIEIKKIKIFNGLLTSKILDCLKAKKSCIKFLSLKIKYLSA
jgi:hypothetical protein